MCVGTIGIDPEYVLHKMTLQEFSLVAFGYEDKIRSQMEQTRLLCFNIYNSSPNKKKSYKITEFMPFYWDKGPDKKEKKPIVRPTAEDFYFLEGILNKDKN